MVEIEKFPFDGWRRDFLAKHKSLKVHKNVLQLFVAKCNFYDLKVKRKSYHCFLVFLKAITHFGGDKKLCVLIQLNRVMKTRHDKPKSALLEFRENIFENYRRRAEKNSN